MDIHCEAYPNMDTQHWIIDIHNVIWLQYQDYQSLSYTPCEIGIR